MSKRVYELLPTPISALAIAVDATLVGSATDVLLSGNTPKDYDFIVDPDRWGEVGLALRMLSPEEIRLNTFGGIKATFNEGTIVMDIWPETMSHFMSNASKVSTMYKAKRNLLITVTPGVV